MLFCIFASVAMHDNRPIVVNARFLLPGKMEGIGWYSHEILSRVVALLPERKFVFLFDRPFDKTFIYRENVTPVVLPPQSRHPLLWYLWFEWSVPATLRAQNAAVFFSPDGYGSLRSKVPQVITIHDLAFEHYPEQVPFGVRKFYTHYVPRYIEHADKIITVSTSTAKDIAVQYGTSPEKISVLHNGCTFSIQPLTEPEKGHIRSRLTGGQPYFMFVSALHPRKNIEGTLRAFDLFISKTGMSHYLLVAGRKAWGNKSMENTYECMVHKDRVVFTGHLDRADLYRYLSASEALVYPSFFEGFGLPLLEAMYCEVPMITSDCSSMPEVAGEAAMLVSPHDTGNIADAMEKLSTDEVMRKKLVAAGKLQREKFSWARSAESLAEMLDRYR